ncbi:MAG TPA: hypothetical protein VN541_02160 [Tepidisphaeraceae bacterium]|nr:hypothetical protein [Tepidisphaeraceae bacterium]
MRLVWFLPVTFVAGIDGFELFVPYLLVVLLIAAACAQLKRISRHTERSKLTPAPADGFSELEPAAA